MKIIIKIAFRNEDKSEHFSKYIIVFVAEHHEQKEKY